MTKSPYEEYYLQQAGSGLPVYSGVRSQRGHGLLSGLARMAIPLLKQSGKTLLKEGFRTGANILGDVLLGRNIKSAAQQRMKQGGQRLFQQATQSVLGGTTQTQKRKTPPAPPGVPAATIKRRRMKAGPQSFKGRRAVRQKGKGRGRRGGPAVDSDSEEGDIFD